MWYQILLPWHMDKNPLQVKLAPEVCLKLHLGQECPKDQGNLDLAHVNYLLLFYFSNRSHLFLEEISVLFFFLKYKKNLYSLLSIF